MPRNHPVPYPERLARLELHRCEIVMRQHPAHMENSKAEILRLLDRRIKALKERAA